MQGRELLPRWGQHRHPAAYLPWSSTYFWDKPTYCYWTRRPESDVCLCKKFLRLFGHQRKNQGWFWRYREDRRMWLLRLRDLRPKACMKVWSFGRSLLYWDLSKGKWLWTRQTFAPKLALGTILGNQSRPRCPFWALRAYHCKCTPLMWTFACLGRRNLTQNDIYWSRPQC